jgi:hypothetical protein
MVIVFLIQVFNSYQKNFHKNNSIRDLIVESLIEMLQRNQSLRTLDISNCSLSDNGKKKLKEAAALKTDFKLNLLIIVFKIDLTMIVFFSLLDLIHSFILRFINELFFFIINLIH